MICYKILKFLFLFKFAFKLITWNARFKKRSVETSEDLSSITLRSNHLDLINEEQKLWIREWKEWRITGQIIIISLVPSKVLTFTTRNACEHEISTYFLNSISCKLLFCFKQNTFKKSFLHDIMGKCHSQLTKLHVTS